jgi:hypothetical protein
MSKLKDKAVRVQPYIDFSPLMTKYGIYDQSDLKRFMSKIVLTTPIEMDKKKLDNFQVAIKPMIDQPLDGLLYDLDLMPEQLKTELDGKRYSAIVNLYLGDYYDA